MDFKSRNTDNELVKYAYDHSMRLHPLQQKLIDISMKSPMHSMLGAAEEVQLFQNLLRLMGAKMVLEVGVFTGYTSMSLAMALPEDGKVVALDITDEYMKQAGTFEIWQQAKVSEKIDLRLGSAVDEMDKLTEGSFDFIFIDADKKNYDNYYEKSLKLVRKGGLIAVDNTLWKGRVLNETNLTPDTAAIRELNDKIFKDDRVDLSFLAIADGVTLCFKK